MQVNFERLTFYSREHTARNGILQHQRHNSEQVHVGVVQRKFYDHSTREIVNPAEQMFSGYLKNY